MSDSALLAHIEVLAARERHATADLVSGLGDVDARRLFLGAGCSSLFTYCTQVLRLSEHAAYGRIEAARCARRFPQIIEQLADGSLTLTAVCLLRPVMTEQNVDALLNAARHKNKRDVEHIVATVRPQPAVPATVRKLPPPQLSPQVTATAPAGSPWPPARPASVQPLAPERYKVQFTLSRDGYQQLRRAQDLMRHTIPNGDPGKIIERAISLLLADLEKKKLRATKRPRSKAVGTHTKNSRHIPAAVQRKVWRRDEGRCAFVGTTGRCTERGFLELHHVVPFADGGEASVENLQLRCRAHNQHEAELWFGKCTAELGPDGIDDG